MADPKTDLKIVIIGAGSFVFGPGLLHQAISENRLEHIELALVDPDSAMCELMAGVGRRMAREAGIPVKITVHGERSSALPGAAFVVCVAARQLFPRFSKDAEIIARYAPGHVHTEFGGVAGISYSLRQMALICEIADDMARYCPAAWLLNISNPLPRVCQAAYQRGIKTVGFCSVALASYTMARLILGKPEEHYPFAQGRSEWSITTAGLNHFTWLLALRNRETGEDLTARLLERVEQGASSGNPVSEAWMRETGYMLVPNDHHTRDFLRPSATTESMEIPSHGTLEERQERLNLLADVGRGDQPIDLLLAHVPWERPFDLIGALAFGRLAEFHSLNLINEGQISTLPRGVFVETPCRAKAGQIQPQPVVLPPTVRALCARTALVTDTIVQAWENRSRAILHQAIELDPTVIDKAAGISAIDACLEAHADLVPAFGR
jgi:alpha-galactosidase